MSAWGRGMVVFSGSTDGPPTVRIPHRFVSLSVSAVSNMAQLSAPEPSVAVRLSTQVSTIPFGVMSMIVGESMLTPRAASFSRFTDRMALRRSNVGSDSIARAAEVACASIVSGAAGDL